MKGIQPRFASEVTFVAVDIGNSDSKQLDIFAQDQEYPWFVGSSNRDMLESLGVKVQSTKIAIDSDGIIVYRAGYGRGTNEEWVSVFERLSGITTGS